MRIDVLGPLRLEGDDGCEREIPERKVRVLLVALVAHRGTALTVDGLVERVWADDPPANPTRTLRAKVSLLRSLLDDARPGARALVATTDGGYRFDDGGGEAVVDADRFLRLARRARSEPDPSARATVWADALSEWRGPPFADVADEVWLSAAVAELSEQRLTAVEERAEALLAVDDPQAALDDAGPWAADHPARERLACAVMLALYRLGRQHEALERYETLRRRLADDLGADPGPAPRELHERILRHDGRLGPQATTAPGRARTNVPTEVSPLIGRDAEVADVDRLLDEARLVTLTGPGGVGKTRLAVRVAGARVDRHPRGVWFADLTALEPGDGDRVAETVALVLGLPEPDDAGADRLAAALGTGPSLLVLDNCEHVVDAVAELVAALLVRVGTVTVLATSREPLGLPDEYRYPVPRMAAGDGTDPGPAVALFAERARAVTEGFVLDEETTPVVVELCRRLDGLPLALELAANRVRVLGVTELTDRLTDRLNLLSRPGRGVPRRQQTLRGMLDWSWSLLDEPERVLLRRLAVHRGGFTLEAAEACAGDLGPGAVALDVLGSLVDRSLVATAPGRGGRVRFHLLEVVAVYAGEKLDGSGERDAVALRHLDHHLSLVRRADAGLRGHAQREWIEVLDDERLNLWHARAEALRCGDGDRAVGLALARFWYEWITGRWRRLGADLDAALALPGSGEPGAHRDRARARVLVVALTAADEPAGAVDRADRVIDDVAGCALAEIDVARVRWFLGSALAAVPGPVAADRRDAAVRHMRAAAEVFERAGDEWHLATTLSQWAWWATVHGGPRPDPPTGRSPMEVLGDLGDRWGVVLALAVEYRDAELAGDTVRSAGLADRALEISRDLDLRDEIVHWTVAVAHTAVREGADGRAADLLADARTLAAEIADADGASFAGLVESVLARCSGDVDRARDALRRGPAPGGDALDALEHGFLAVAGRDRDAAAGARDTARASGLLTGAATARLLELDAGVAAVGGDPAAARRLIVEAEDVRAGAGHVPTRVERSDAGLVRLLLGD